MVASSLVRPTSIPNADAAVCPELPSIERSPRVHGPCERRRLGGARLLTVEGENDDISGIGQTLAAQELCRSIPQSMKANYLQNKVGHFGVFNGSRFVTRSCPGSGNSISR
jgi:poly-beta-hydroxyalkanoate depolymerase